MNETWNVARLASLLVLTALASACHEPATSPEPGVDTAARSEPDPADEPPARPPAEPETLNTGPACESATDCAAFPEHEGVSWQCVSRHYGDARRCWLLAPDGELYCDSDEDCPEGRQMPAYTESISCEEHLCVSRGHVTDPRAHGDGVVGGEDGDDAEE